MISFIFNVAMWKVKTTAGIELVQSVYVPIRLLFCQSTNLVD